MLYWGVQASGWTIYFLFYIFVLYSADVFRLTPHLFVSAAFSVFILILLSNLIRYFILRLNIISKKVYQIVLITFILATVASTLYVLLNHAYDLIVGVDYLVHSDGDVKELTLPGFFFSLLRTVTMLLVWCGFYYAFIILEKSKAQEILNLKWEASKNEIELKNLRAQLNPHFLFNSLNSIRALVGINPDQAKTSITELSTLLRQSINLGKMRVISLRDELDLVKIYLDLEQIRFEERLQIEYQVSEDSLPCEIPPLMIQTIVENGIKHGISKSIDGGFIRLISSYSNSELQLEIRNTGHLNPSNNGGGIGVSNSKKRLEILYGKEAEFSIFQDKDEVVVKINIRYK